MPLNIYIGSLTHPLSEPATIKLISGHAISRVKTCYELVTYFKTSFPAKIIERWLMDDDYLDNFFFKKFPFIHISVCT